MALQGYMDVNAVGAEKTFTPLQSTFAVRDQKARHTPGTCAMGIGSEWTYVKFGEDVAVGDLVMYDEMFGERRTAGGDADQGAGTVRNGAIKVRADSNGATVRFVGLVLDAPAKAGQYGWVMVRGAGWCRFQYDATQHANTPGSGNYGVDEIDGGLTAADTATAPLLTGVAARTPAAAAANTRQDTLVILTHPSIIMAGGAATAAGAQPRAAAAVLNRISKGTSGEQLYSNE